MNRRQRVIQFLVALELSREGHISGTDVLCLLGWVACIAMLDMNKAALLISERVKLCSVLTVRTLLKLIAGFRAAE